MAQLELVSRPFAVEPYTRLQLPDGIFVTSLLYQQITCFLRNKTGSELTDVSVFFESVGDPTINVDKTTFTFARIPPNGIVEVSWRGIFRSAKAGKPWVSIRADTAGSSQRFLRQIFVAMTSYGNARGEYVCVVPEGRLRLTFDELIGPKAVRGGERDIRYGGPWLPTRFTASVEVPFEGSENPLAFEDPLWKILAGVLAFLAFIGASLADDIGSENASEVKCETDIANGGEICTTEIPVKDALYILAMGLVKVAWSDADDPWSRGRRATASSARTYAEVVECSASYPQIIEAGEPYGVNVAWTYTRLRLDGAESYSVSETVENSHLLKKVEATFPSEVVQGSSFELTCRFQKEDALYYEGESLFVVATAVSPSSSTLKFSFQANGEVFRMIIPGGQLADYPGLWKVFLHAQTVNLAPEGSDPETAAKKYSGGDLILAPFALTANKGMCPVSVRHPTIEFEVVP